MKKHIPNIITLCNLTCGCIAVRFAFADRYGTALCFIIAGAIFDFFDGFAARKLKVSSPMGVELDSLADVITFGLAPAAMMFSLITTYIHNYAIQTDLILADSWIKYINIAALLVAAFSALRLAKFNVDKRQTNSFIGLPTPANALLISSIVITLNNHTDWLMTISGNAISPYLIGIITLCAISVVSSILLVAEIPLFALKFKNFSLKDNSVRYIFLLSSAVILAIFALCSLTRLIAGIGLVIVWYIILSLATMCKSK